MSQFYTTDLADYGQCHQSMREQAPLIIATKVDGQTRQLKGVVQAIEEDRHHKPKRWLVTMIDIE